MGLGGIGVSVSGAMETGPRGGPCVPERRGSEDDGFANIVMTSAMAVAVRAPGLKPALGRSAQSNTTPRSDSFVAAPQRDDPTAREPLSHGRSSGGAHRSAYANCRPPGTPLPWHSH